MHGKVLFDWPGAGCNESLRFSHAEQLGKEPYDVAIVGAGAVGCALAYKLSLFRLKILLVDRNYDVGEGTSKGNSAIVHTGFDAPVASLESRLVTQASRLWPVLAEKLKIPYNQCGALLLAMDQEQRGHLDEIFKKALRNGVEDVQQLSQDQARALEPGIPDYALGGLLIPREAIADPFAVPVAFAEVALENGVDVLLGAQIAGVANAPEPVKDLITARGKRIAARILINAAGLGSRALADCYSGGPFQINPRRGQFLIFDKYSRSAVRRILLPVPTAQTKGVLVIPTIFGNLIAGPTAEDLPLDAAGITDTTREGLQEVMNGASRMFPPLRVQPVIGTYAGARCNCAQGSYLIRFNDGCRGTVTVTGIRSTGFTSSPTLADHLVQGLIDECGLKLEPKSGAVDGRPEDSWPGWWRKPFEDDALLKARPDYGKIVCNCENISRGEILKALRSPLKPQTLDSMKRRTRAYTGRCQGFDCHLRLAEIIADHCGIPLESVTKNGPGSELAHCETGAAVESK